MRWCAVVVVLLALCVVPASNAWAQQPTIRACVKNVNGQVRIVVPGEACLASEHAVEWTAGGAPAPTASSSLRVVDKADVLVGYLISSSAVARQSGDVWVSLSVTADGFATSSPYNQIGYYQNSSCSGDAYLPVDAGLLRAGMMIADGTGKITFLYAGTTLVDKSTIHWYGHFSGTVWTCSDYTPAWWMTSFGKVQSADLSEHQAPFKIVGPS